MKRKLFFGLLAAVLGTLPMTSCGGDGSDAAAPAVQIAVSHVTAQSATVAISANFTPTVTRFVSAVSVEALEAEEVDPKDAEAVYQWLVDNGTHVTLPYTAEATDLEPASDYLTGIVCFDANYQRIAATVEIFQTAVPENSIGDHNGAGSVTENEW